MLGAERAPAPCRVRSRGSAGAGKWPWHPEHSSCRCVLPHGPAPPRHRQLPSPASLQRGWRRRDGRRGAKGEKFGGRAARQQPLPTFPRTAEGTDVAWR